MPYRRLPTTDKARLRALENALDKASKQDGEKPVISMPIVEELKLVSTRFKNALTQYEMDVRIQSENNHKYKQCMASAQMYISHFIQVLFMSQERGEINGGLKYYGLEGSDGKIPSLQTEEEILQWSEKIIKGEQLRIQHGGSAIYNPSIALVKIKAEEFNDALIFQNNLRRNTSRSFDKMCDIRKTTNEFIGRMWTGIEENIKVEDAKIKRQMLQEYGVVYIFRRKEKKKLGAEELQRDLLFDFG